MIYKKHFLIFIKYIITDPPLPLLMEETVMQIIQNSKQNAIKPLFWKYTFQKNNKLPF